MKNRLKTIIKEPSSYVGAALVLNGAADLATQMGQTLAMTGSFKAAIASMALGLIAIVMREGGSGPTTGAR